MTSKLTKAQLDAILIATIKAINAKRKEQNQKLLDEFIPGEEWGKLVTQLNELSEFIKAHKDWFKKEEYMVLDPNTNQKYLVSTKCLSVHDIKISEKEGLAITLNSDMEIDMNEMFDKYKKIKLNSQLKHILRIPYEGYFAGYRSPYFYVDKDEVDQIALELTLATIDPSEKVEDFIKKISEKY